MTDTRLEGKIGGSVKNRRHGNWIRRTGEKGRAVVYSLLNPVE